MMPTRLVEPSHKIHNFQTLAFLQGMWGDKIPPLLSRLHKKRLRILSFYRSALDSIPVLSQRISFFASFSQMASTFVIFSPIYTKELKPAAEIQALIFFISC